MQKTKVKMLPKRPRLLIVGCGDIGQRLLKRLSGRLRVYALTRNPSEVPLLRALGAAPIVADLDQVQSLWRLRGLADWVIHLAPPAAIDSSAVPIDQRTQHLLRMVQAKRLVYISTSGVYGDAQGQWLDETHTPQPRTARALRRLDAERQCRAYGLQTGCQVSILRVPGIYDHGQRSPLKRLRAQTPVPIAEQDVYTNHIHADDLASACILALMRARPQRITNICDDCSMKLGDYLDTLADQHHLPKPPRLERDALRAQLGNTTMTFLSESRRLRNQRMKQELGVRLQHRIYAKPDVEGSSTAGFGKS